MPFPKLILIVLLSEAALSSFTVEDFESYAVDTPFHTVPVDVGDFTISMAEPDPNTNYNFIDIAPLILQRRMSTGPTI